MLALIQSVGATYHPALISKFFRYSVMSTEFSAAAQINSHGCNCRGLSINAAITNSGAAPFLQHVL